MLEEGVDFSDHFYGELDQAFDNDDGQAGWVFEYGWAPYHCDPCVDGEALSENLVTELGFSQGAQGAYFSKLRMRYSPDQVTGDLNLVGSRITENEQVRYIEFNESMGDRFEVCGQGYVETLGDCYDTFDDLDQEQGRSNRGCSSRPLGRGWMVLGLLGMLVMGRRRAN